MKLVIALNFLVLATIMAGLFFIARANYGHLEQSSRYWSIAIVCDAVGLALMGVLFILIPDFSQSSRLGTVSNTLLFASIVYQAISIRALNAQITKIINLYTFFGTVVFSLLWEYARLNTDINTRVLLFASYAILALLWQLTELGKHTKDSSQIRIIRLSIIGEIFFTALRFFAVSNVSMPIVRVEELPVLGLFSLWIQYGLKIVVYAGLLAYWSEDLTRQKTRIELESQQFKELSERQEQFIADLGRLNKVATAGVMAASIAHELSQPLQSLVLNIELSQHELATDNPDHQLLVESLDTQSISAEKMVEVIRTMRSVFTESESADMPVDLYELIQKLTVFITPQANKRGIEVQYIRQGNLFIAARSAEIQQVILNLVANAFDAIDLAARTIKKIRVTVTQHEGFVICHVEDSGPGLPTHVQKTAFSFLKTNKSSGMGLGLWLSKYIIERNRGEISVTDSELGGAMFTIKLLVAAPMTSNA